MTVSVRLIGAGALLFLYSVSARGQGDWHAPPGAYRTSWVGNTFGGDGGPNGFGDWVQNAADEIEVTPDGTVLAGCGWDEAGRCVGLYKDGRVNRVLVKHEGGPETAWGWNTGNNALAVDGANVFVANTGKRLLRFTWKPGELDSVTFAEEHELPAEAVGLNARAGRLAVAYADRIELRDVAKAKVLAGFAVPEVKDVVLAEDGSLWLIAGGRVRRFDADGRERPAAFDEVGNPSAVSFDRQGRLIVCDDGPDQQVKFFDIAGEKPAVAATFGARGGLRSGTPGEAAPDKLYGLRGAGTDAAGNLYVALGYSGAPVGTLVIRSFTPDGALRWEVANHAFVDTFGFDPGSDGRIVYGRTAAFDLDLDRTEPGSEWRHKASTIDAVRRPDDPRLPHGATVYLCRLERRRLLYAIGQYGGGYRLFTFDEPDGFLAKPAGQITAPGETWAWHVAASGDIWHGDAPGRTIRRHAFRGWTADGAPRFETAKPDEWPWPEDFELVRRVIYDEAADVLYLSGYLKVESIDSWGVCGKMLRRYDGWLRGGKSAAWTVKLPLNPEGEGQGKPLSPEAIALAGDYLFVGMVKPDDGKQHTHVLAAADGKYVGSFAPGPEVGGNAGWQDMPYAVNALRRANGEYLVLVEEDFRGKNLLYRWVPGSGK